MAEHKHAILVIEDDPFLRKTLSAKLARSGFLVDEAGDAAEADRALKKRRPCMVFLDILLPRMNGFEWLEKARKDRALKDLPVIVISQFDLQEYLDRARSLGVIEYVVKANTSLAEILRRAEKAIGEAEGTAKAGKRKTHNT